MLPNDKSVTEVALQSEVDLREQPQMNVSVDTEKQPDLSDTANLIASATENVAAAESTEPNVILGQNGKPLPEGPISIGMYEPFYIPSEDEQRAGFYIPPHLVSVLIAQFSGFEFKKFLKLGQQ